MAGIRFLEELTSVFLYLTENPENTTLLFGRWNTKQYLEKQSGLKEQPVNWMERLFKTALLSRGAWGTSVTLWQRRNPVWLLRWDTPKSFLNSQGIFLDVQDGDGYGAPRDGGCCLQSTLKPQVGGCHRLSCAYSFWSDLEGDLSTCTDTREVQTSWEDVASFVTWVDNAPCRRTPGWFRCITDPASPDPCFTLCSSLLRRDHFHLATTNQTLRKCSDRPH